MSLDIESGITIYHPDGSTEFIPFFSKVICRCPELDESSPCILLDMESELQQENDEVINSLELVKEEDLEDFCSFKMEPILVPCCNIESIEVIEE